jgi:hypothetical protein
MKKLNAFVLMAVIARGFCRSGEGSESVMLRFSRLLCPLQRVCEQQG